jgi:hypothetical protein
MHLSKRAAIIGLWVMALLLSSVSSESVQAWPAAACPDEKSPAAAPCLPSADGMPLVRPAAWPRAPLPRTFFGMHIHRPHTIWPSLNGSLGAVRIWDTAAQWADVNPAKGVFQWAVLDYHVSRARAHGADVIMTLGRTPRWASARPTEPSAYGPGQAAEPALDQYWQDWVRAVATRYQGKIRYWEIWNEPNDPAFFSGSAEKLVDLSRQAYTILKTSDPQNQVLSPSPYEISYLDYYLSLGGGAVADVIGYHFYLDEAPEALANWYIPRVWAVLEAHGQAAKPLWNTEGGYLRPVIPGPKTLSDDLGAAYLARTYLLNWAGGVSRFYFYAWDNHTTTNIELTAADDVALTTAGVAYRELAGWLLGARLTDLSVDENGVWIVSFDQATGDRAHIVWRTSTTVTFAPPPAWNVQSARMLTGARRSLAGRTQLAVGLSPLLLESTPVNSLFLPLVSGWPH